MYKHNLEWKSKELMDLLSNLQCTVLCCSLPSFLTCLLLWHFLVSPLLFFCWFLHCFLFTLLHCFFTPFCQWCIESILLHFIIVPDSALPPCSPSTVLIPLSFSNFVCHFSCYKLASLPCSITLHYQVFSGLLHSPQNLQLCFPSHSMCQHLCTHTLLCDCFWSAVTLHS